MSFKKLITLTEKQKEFIDQNELMFNVPAHEFISNAINIEIERVKKLNQKIIKK